MNVFCINFWLAFALFAVMTIASEPEIKATPQRRQLSPGDGHNKPNTAPQRRQFSPVEGHYKPNTAPQQRPQFSTGNGCYEQYPAPDWHYEHHIAPHRRQLSASGRYYEPNTAPRSSLSYPAQRQWNPSVAGGKSAYQQRRRQYESKNNYPNEKQKPIWG